MPASSHKPSDIRKRFETVAVIGGGFSGAAAARHLHLAGFTNVVLLEAASISGRASTEFEAVA